MDHQRGRIIATIFPQGLFHQTVRRVAVLPGRFGSAQKLDQITIVKSLYQTISAEEKEVPCFVRYRAQLRDNKLVAPAQGFLKDITTRMGAGLPFVEFPFAEEPANMRVIVAELLQ